MPRHRHRAYPLARVLVTGLASVTLCSILASCASTTSPQTVSAPSTTCAPVPADGASPSPSPSPSESKSSTRGTTAPILALTPPHVAGVTWVPHGREVRGRHPVSVAQVDGGAIGLMWMDPSRLSFRFIPGFKYPEGSPIRNVDTSPSTWVPRLVAAFNGGFELKDDAGGYFYAGQWVRQPRKGLATFVVLKNGHMRVGVWGADLNGIAGVEAIRQNLRPLVLKGKAQASSDDDPGRWGLANGGLSHANRSALGQLSDGSLVFAYGSEVRASDMADALARVGVRTAVMLDMNKSWPMAFYYSAPSGGHDPVGHRILSSVWRDSTEYQQQFTKDFVVALAPTTA